MGVQWEDTNRVYEMVEPSGGKSDVVVRSCWLRPYIIRRLRFAAQSVTRLRGFGRPLLAFSLALSLSSISNALGQSLPKVKKDVSIGRRL